MVKKQFAFCKTPQWLGFIHKILRQFRISCLLVVLFMSAALLPAAIASIPVKATIGQVNNFQQLEQQARQLYQSGQFTAAVDLWQRLAASFEASSDRLGQAMALSNLSLTYQQLGQLDEADKAIASSLTLIQNSEFKTQNSRLLSAQALDVQGRLQFAQGQAESALTIWRQAAAIYAEMRDNTRLTRNRINQAQALQALGLYRQAQAVLSEATQALQTEPNTALKAAGLRSLGNVLRVVGNLEQARQVLEQSLTVAQAVDKQAIADTLLSLGNTVRAQQDHPSALKFYQQAASTSVSLNTRTQAQLNQLSLLIQSQQFSDAEAFLPQIQTQIEQLPLSRSTVHAKINFAQSLMSVRGERVRSNTLQDRLPPGDIARLLAVAIQQAKELGDSRTESYAIGTLGALYETTQQWAEARDLTRQALLIAQEVDASEIAYRWQWQLGRLLKQQWELTGRRSQSVRDSATAAYDAAIKSLQSLRYDLVSISPDVQFSFREEVEPVYRELVALLLESPGTPVPQSNLLKAREVVESLQIAEVNNFLREACLEPKRQIDLVIDQDQTAAAIYPIILPDRLEVILKLPQQPLRHHTVAIAQLEVEKALDDLRQNLRKPHTLQSIQSLSGQVYDWLIRPVEAELAKSQVKTLAFVLDGNLRNIPMSVLYDGNQYLVEKYSLALTPGLQLINPKPLGQVKLQALAAGISESRPPFSELPNVPIELKQIQSQLSGQVLLNQQFTTQQLQKQINAQSFPIIHLATHGQFSSNADQTFILAWDKPIKVNELNTLLRTRDEAGVEAIELLVLSACQTAVGDKRAALGIAGVAVRAGARSTLASLWNVNDASTALLMGQFYQAIADNQMTKAQALRQAQLALLRNPKYQRPMFWAPYVLVGNWL